MTNGPLQPPQMSYRAGNHLSKFKNLQILSLGCHVGNLNGIRESDWKDLKELNLTILFKWPDKASYEELKSWLVKIQLLRASAGRKDRGKEGPEGVPA